MTTRRQIIKATAAVLAGATSLLGRGRADAGEPAAPTRRQRRAAGFTPTVTLNGATMPWTWEDGFKTFRFTAEPVEQEFVPGTVVKCWGYNGRTPGPTIEVVEGDKVRIYVTNKLPEHTTIHWHGIFLPAGMDGVGGLNQPQIKPGETYVYEFTLRQHGTFMYHPHADEMTQMAVGLMGMFIVHPREREENPIDRDFVILPHEWAIHPGTYRPDPMVMLDFNMFTFNGKVFPAIDPLVVKTGDRVRVRFGNLSMDEHPIHLHGYSFWITATDGGVIPKSARWPQTTVPVPVGSTRDIEFTADVPGDWAFHCHKSHHTMNQMGHDVPNMLGVPHDDIAKTIRRHEPGFMAMGAEGMAEMQDMSGMPRPENTAPMMMGVGPFGNLEMGGMFTVLKVRDGLKTYDDPGWYEYPEGTQARKVG